jgi:Domain of unknown function (DUF4407)
MDTPEMIPLINEPDSPEIPPVSFSWWQRFLFILAGRDLGIMKRSPPPDHTNAYAIGLLIILNWVYVTFLFSALGMNLLADGHFRLDVFAVCAFLASYLVAIDVYAFNHSGDHQNGLRELKRGGLDLTGGMADTVRSYGYLAVRLILSLGLAQLSALAFALLWYGADISAQINSRYQAANAVLIQQMTGSVDAGIKRLAGDRAAQAEHVKGLTDQVAALRQAEIDPSAGDPQVQESEHELDELLDQRTKAQDGLAKAESFATSELGGIRSAPGNSGVAGAGPRYRAAMQRVSDAKARAQEIDNEISTARERLDELHDKLGATSQAKEHHAHDQLPNFEQALAAAQSKLQSLADQLAQSTAHRNAAIEERVRSAPNYVPRSEGMLARLKALENITNEDSKAGYTILVVELVAFGLELAFVMCKVFAYVPTTYSAILAGDHYRRIVRIANEVSAATTEPPANDNGPDGQAARDAVNDNQPNGHAATGTEGFDLAGAPAQPPKRKRGRPPKNPRITDANGSQGNSGMPPKKPE